MTSARPAAVLTLVAGLVLASCGGEDAEKPVEPPTVVSSPSPSSDVEVPADVTLTEVGSELAFGDTATVIHEPNPKRGSVLSLTVDAATKGTTKDFAGFILDDYTRAATPYYVDVRVENVGEGRVGGNAVPLWGVDADNTLLPPATFTTTFRRCPSKPLPDGFAPGDSFRTCLVYLAPERGRLEAVSFRPNQQFDPIRWTGEITTPAPAPKKQGKKGGSKQGPGSGNGTKRGGDRG